MMDGAPNVDAHNWFHQLQVCKLLQHKDMVVCLEDLNGDTETLQFTFQELPFWDAAAASEPTHEPQLMEVDLSGVQPESVTMAIQTPNSTPILPPPAGTAGPSGNITAAINLQLIGAMELLQQASPITSACLPVQHIKETTTICSSGGSACSWKIERSPQARGDGLCHPCPDGNPHADVSAGGHSSQHPQLHPYHSSAAPANPAKDITGGKHPLVTQLQGPSKGGPASFADKLLHLQQKMNMALEQLLTNRATMDFHHRELELNMELAVCLNDTQATEAIKEDKVHHTTAACALQQAQRDGVLVLECEVKVEEGRITTFLWKPLGQPCEPVHQSPIGHSCNPCSSWLMMCP